MQTPIHDDAFFRVLWDENTSILGIQWKEATSWMTDEDFKSELQLFAGLVESRRTGFSGTCPLPAQDRTGRARMAHKEYLDPLQRGGRAPIRIPAARTSPRATDDEPILSRRELCDPRIQQRGTGDGLADRDATR